MRIPVTTASLIFQERMGQLRAEGIQPDDDELAWLMNVCDRMANPQRYRPPTWEPPIFEKGAFRLPQLTVAASSWLTNYAATWYPAGKRMDILSTAFAMAHGEADPLPFPSLHVERDATRAIHVWMERVPLTFRALQKIVMEYCDGGVFVEIKSPNEPQVSVLSADEALDWGPVLARMAWAYKIHPRYLMRLTDDQFLDLKRNMPREDGSQAEAESSSRDEEMVRLVVKAIRDRHLAENPKSEIRNPNEEVPSGECRGEGAA